MPNGSRLFYSRLNLLSRDGSRVFFNSASEPYDPARSGSWELGQPSRSPLPTMTPAQGSIQTGRQGMVTAFFAATASLVPDDEEVGPCAYADGKRSDCVDVYERTRDGVLGSCRRDRASREGQPFDAQFVGASSGTPGRHALFVYPREARRRRHRSVPQRGGPSPRLPLICTRTSTGVTRLVSIGPRGEGSAGVCECARAPQISADGEAHLLQSRTSSLVPEDTDSGWPDLYERKGDALRLVSTGPTATNGPFEAQLSGISKDGSHVFFATPERLVAADTDGADLYTGTGRL